MTLLSTLAGDPDIEALLAAAADPGSDLAPGPRRKLVDAAGYLAVAPTVCKVAVDVPLPAQDYTLPSTPVDHDALIALADRWDLGSPIARLVDTITRTR